MIRKTKYAQEIRKVMESKSEWWKGTVIYQIYPWSFSDSNGDGIGDLHGIIGKLDYLSELGVETIWFSPFFKSPGKDFGYDISNYLEIDPRFGTMKDCDKLIREIHKRKMRIVLDMVMNHTSNEHPWFLESSSSKTNPKRDFYIWKPGKNGKPPNNWKSMVGSSGWNLDPKTGEYYYTNFLSFQPDLNYRNPEVKKAMFQVLEFWLKKGVDGFRLDIFNSIYKDKNFSDNPASVRFFPTPDNHDEAFFQKKVNNLNLPESFVLAKEVRSLLAKFKQKPFVIGEVSGNDRILKSFLGERADGLNLVFQFELIHFEFYANFFRTLLEKNEREFSEPYQPVYVFGNHDQRRFIDRIKGDEKKAKILSCFQLTARGVPVIYYGEEIGRPEGDISILAGKDPIAKMNSLVPKFLSDLLGIYINRDNCRLPMLWDEGKNASFSVGESWLGVGKYKKEQTVAYQKTDENSLWKHYQKLIQIRKKEKALQFGKLDLLPVESESLLAYVRKWKEEEISVFLNFGKETFFLKDLGKHSVLYQFGKVDLLRNELGSFSGLLLKKAK